MDAVIGVGQLSSESSQDKITDFLKKNKPALTINRVPEPTLKRFKEMAEAEFAGDYGWLLKTLVDNALDTRLAELAEAVNDCIIRINKLENKPEKEIRLCSGAVLKRKGKGDLSG